ncbi:hypothetical protein CYMTET_16036 [Cymbomonas tetramitiformis]|uniref:Uncharacterized protein n=1 Tax=Cymbomonas tetramitiformis TaxID=36881 RepID=A0AAE0GD60_9CHLO|nr:hypothetical protein CYMTET_16036 [Cymbomonas tetramitiformis]
MTQQGCAEAAGLDVTAWISAGRSSMAAQPSTNRWPDRRVFYLLAPCAAGGPERQGWGEERCALLEGGRIVTGEGDGQGVQQGGAEEGTDSVRIVCNGHRGHLMFGNCMRTQTVKYAGEVMLAKEFVQRVWKKGNWMKMCHVEEFQPPEPVGKWLARKGALMGSIAIGQRLEVYWPACGKYYPGTLVKFLKDSGYHNITYDDGDKEIMHLALRRFRWLDRPATTPRAPDMSSYGRQRTESWRAGTSCSTGVDAVNRADSHMSTLCHEPNWNSDELEDELRTQRPGEAVAGGEALLTVRDASQRLPTGSYSPTPEPVLQPRARAPGNRNSRKGKGMASPPHRERRRDENSEAMHAASPMQPQRQPTALPPGAVRRPPSDEDIGAMHAASPMPPQRQLMAVPPCTARHLGVNWSELGDWPQQQPAENVVQAQRPLVDMRDGGRTAAGHPAAGPLVHRKGAHSSMAAPDRVLGGTMQQSPGNKRPAGMPQHSPPPIGSGMIDLTARNKKPSTAPKRKFRDSWGPSCASGGSGIREQSPPRRMPSPSPRDADADGDNEVATHDIRSSSPLYARQQQAHPMRPPSPVLQTHDLGALVSQVCHDVGATWGANEEAIGIIRSTLLGVLEPFPGGRYTIAELREMSERHWEKDITQKLQDTRVGNLRGERLANRLRARIQQLP